MSHCDMIRVANQLRLMSEQKPQLHILGRVYKLYIISIIIINITSSDLENSRKKKVMSQYKFVVVFVCSILISVENKIHISQQ